MRIEAIERDGQHRTAWHQHECGQLFWLCHGLIIIETEREQWVITPGSVGWFPAHFLHSARMPGRVKGKCLYLDPPSATTLPADSGVYGADAFIFALLERVCQNGSDASRGDYRDALLNVLAFEMNQLSELPLQLKFPEDRRARSVAGELLNNPGSTLNQAQLAKKWGLSVRNLSRLFIQDTGLSFSRWRQQAKVITSLQWIFAGLPVSEVASLSGYSNVSTYIEIFRQRFGKTPGQFKEQV